MSSRASSTTRSDSGLEEAEMNVGLVHNSMKATVQANKQGLRYFSTSCSFRVLRCLSIQALKYCRPYILPNYRLGTEFSFVINMKSSVILLLCGLAAADLQRRQTIVVTPTVTVTTTPFCNCSPTGTATSQAGGVAVDPIGTWKAHS